MWLNNTKAENAFQIIIFGKIWKESIRLWTLISKAGSKSFISSRWGRRWVREVTLTDLVAHQLKLLRHCYSLVPYSYFYNIEIIRINHCPILMPPVSRDFPEIAWITVSSSRWELHACSGQWPLIYYKRSRLFLSVCLLSWYEGSDNDN